MAVTDPDAVASFAGSRFVVSPVVEAFHRAALGPAESIGVVATPCQALALAKMRMRPFSKDDARIGKLSLVVGLFCGWALSWRGLEDLVRRSAGDAEVARLDVPPSGHHVMEVEFGGRRSEISIDEVEPIVRESCRYCFDMTAEFSDLSVGSARLPEGWETAKGWNQVIVRTEAGGRLMDLARDRGVLTFREVPPGNLERLKSASMNKKAAAIRRLARLSGSSTDLLYLDCDDPVLCLLGGGDGAAD